LITVTKDRINWALAACSRILRPVVKLALAMGLKHQDLDDLLRNLLLSEARKSWLAQGVEPNISQLSVSTGLNRKAVTAKIREPGDTLPRPELSTAAKTLTLWLQMLHDHPAQRKLPIVAVGDELSFEALARRASRGNVHHRTVLDELVRLNMANEQDGLVELKADGFVPAADLRSMLAFLADNAQDHLLAGVANTLGEAPPLLERAVFAKGLTVQQCEQLHQLVRQRWAALHEELAREMTRAVDEAGDAGASRMRVGIYTYHEDDAKTRRKPSGKGSGPRGTKS